MNRQIINRRYRVERKIGEGAAAEVYLGFDIVLNRRVAIKTLRLPLATNRAFRLRFEREAQTAARLAHPNIIAIFDVGDDHGLPYIVMEYVEGQTLKKIIDAEGPFHPDDVAILAEQVAAGLDFAHKHGLVHRDVKPGNILVDRHGLAKIADFGIAKGISDSSLTETGTSLGTVNYISPEQASGLMATPESDIYSLGVVAFEMLTGQCPFEATNSVTVAMAHLDEPAPDPSQLNPNVPPEVADIVLQALEKNPTRRFPTAGAFARALSDWRLYEPAPRLAAKLLTSAPVSKVPEADAHPNITTLPSPAERRDKNEYDDENGRGKSWLAGAIAVVAIAALLWYGFDLSDRFNEADGEAVSTPTAIAVQKTPTPLPTQTAQALIAVPNVVGLSQAEAENRITSAGFEIAVGTAVTSDSIPSGFVIDQNPAADAQVAIGSIVTLTLSSGRAGIDLAGLNAPGRPSDVVVDELTSVGLNVQIVEEGSITVAEGNVIRLEPADAANPGDQVTVVVSKGDRVQIPVDLQSQPLAIARTRLTALGLTVANEVPVSRGVIEGAGIDLAASEIENGDVVGIQDNGAQFGGWVASGSSVTLVYYDAELAD